MKKLFNLLTIALFFSFSGITTAQTDLGQTVPIEEGVKTGVLENGLTYYIKHNEEPKNRASFYIIQNVGALLEKENQNGLAHFLEHMAFNGTKNFEGKGILNTLERHGVAFGRNINAYTAYNQTVYNMSNVPSEPEGLVDTCLLILHDWSDGLLLTDEEIDMERGVIREEWRTRRNSGFRLRRQWFPVVFEESMWAERDIIGDTTVIKTHDPETLRNFYHDWYRTDLQAIAIVGDIDANEVEKQVKELFSSIKAVTNPIERPVFEIPDHEETRFVVATDEEATQSGKNIYIRHKNNDGREKSYKEHRGGYIRSLYNAMTSQRIRELLEKGEPPFISGYTRIGGLVRGYDAYSIGVTANDGEEEKALEAILTETERIKRHGFTPGELERAKKDLLSRIENQYKQRDKINNDTYCRQFASHYLTGSPINGIEDYYHFAVETMPTITLDELFERAQKWISDKNRSIVITGPENSEHLTEQKALDIFTKVENMEIAPYEDTAMGTTFINHDLKGSKVINTRRLEEFDAVEWTLENNATVVFRHADYQKDQVLFNAFSKGGSSIWDDEYVPSLSLATNFVSAYGLGDYDATTLNKMLSGINARVQPHLGTLTEELNGSSAPKDFETLMQLVYLSFEKPRFDKETHDALMSRYLGVVKNLQNEPRKIREDSLGLIWNNYHPRIRVLDTEFLEDISFDAIRDIYTDRFQDAEDFTFLIVGNIDEETAKTMSEKYIGSLTSTSRNETWIDRKIEAPEGKTEKIIPIKLTTPKTHVNIRYENDSHYNQKNQLMLNVLRGILDLRYTETVREEEGGSYGVSVNSNFSQYPSGKATLMMSFDCEPQRANELKAIIYREIDKIAENGPTADDFQKTIKNILKDREQHREHNPFWMEALYNYYFRGINTVDKENYELILENMTQNEIHKFTKTFIADANLMDVLFVPDEQENPGE